MILAGTAPSGAGGIASSLQIWRDALADRGSFAGLVPTHRTGPASQKLQLAWSARSKLDGLLAQESPERTVVVAHGGAWLSLARETRALSRARHRGFRTVLCLHGDELADYLLGAQKHAILALIRRSDALTVLTPWWGQLLRESGYSGRLFTWPNPMPSINVAGAPEPSSTSHIVTMTRLVPGKNVDVVIRAMAKLPGARLTVAGTGGQDAELQALTHQLGLSDRVHFAGWVGGDAKNALLASADVFCLPSTYDSFGMGFVEAMMQGTPVVAADWRAISDVVAPEPLGVLIPSPPQPEDLAAALRRVIEAEPSRAAVRNHAVQNFAAERVIDTALRDVELAFFR